MKENSDLNQINSQITTQYLKDLVDNTSEIIMLLSLDGKFLFVNQTFHDALGYSSEELETMVFENIIHPQFSEETLSNLHKIREDEQVHDFQTVIRNKEGKRVYLSGDVSCRIEEGRPVAYRCLFRDITQRRRAEKEGNKDYGILSVLLQAFYDIKYEFTVLPGAFNPPPKVDSGVITLKRNNVEKLDCDERLFFNVVKTGFNQRRKMLRNPLKMLGVKFDHHLLDKRAEQLSVADFVDLTKAIMEAKNKQVTS